jgi:DNA modification methylase
MTNTLYFGDNLPVLRERIPDRTVDLVYLDPPFNSDAAYNIFFKTPTRQDSEAQTHAFIDSWEWGPAADDAMKEIMRIGGSAAGLINALYQFLGQSDLMAYLVMMTVRLLELKRVMKPSRSMYLHCDPTASHYLKIILDALFGGGRFRSEIVWRRSNSHNKLSKQYGPIHDTILFFTNSAEFYFAPGRTLYTKQYIESEFRFSDERGRYAVNNLMGPGKRAGVSGQPWRDYDPSSRNRHWAISDILKKEIGPSAASMTPQQQLDVLDDLGFIKFSRSGRPKYKQYPVGGVLYQDIWAFQPGTDGTLYGAGHGIDQDVKWLDSESERIGYPTQKPLGLLRRIIETSSRTDQIILDPFCGCGTAIHAAEDLKRQWIGIDVAHAAIQIVEDRLRKHFPTMNVDIRGRPESVEDAIALFKISAFQFQGWASWLAGGQPRGAGEEVKRGGDRGVDGELYFKLDATRNGKAVISVKGGVNINPAMVREIEGTRAARGADLGLFVCLRPPTKEMQRAADEGGKFPTNVGNFPRIQIRTIAELLSGNQFLTPPLYDTQTAAEAMRRSERATRRRRREADAQQRELLLPIAGGEREGSQGKTAVPQRVRRRRAGLS